MSHSHPTPPACAALINSIELPFEDLVIGDFASLSHGLFRRWFWIAGDRVSPRAWASRTRCRRRPRTWGPMIRSRWCKTGRTTWPRAGSPSRKRGWTLCPSPIRTMTWALLSCTRPPFPMRWGVVYASEIASPCVCLSFHVRPCIRIGYEASASVSCDHFHVLSIDSYYYGEVCAAPW